MTFVTGLKGVLEILRNNQMKSEVPQQLCSLKKLFWISWEFLENIYNTYF